MKKYSADQLVKLALQNDPKCIGDRLYCLAWCWCMENYDQVDEAVVEAEFARLVRRSDPFTIERQRERQLSLHPDLEPRKESTKALRDKIVGKVGLFS
jgi:hypothetical protein